MNVKMSIMRVVILIGIFSISNVLGTKNREFPVMDVPELVRYWGYEIETHYVTTDDGYILGMHRIPHGKNGTKNGMKNKPVFMTHCLVCNSAIWLFGPPEKSFGYLLADQGYDVWFGNTRGNTYSRNHWFLSPSDNDFWDFGFDDSGVLDYKAEIDYILEMTGEDQVHFIGHSMGTTQFFVFASELEEYNNKIAGAYLMGPAVTMTNANNPIFLISEWAGNVEILFHLFGQYEFLPHYDIISWIAHFFCDVTGNAILGELCENIVFLVTGINEAQLNMTMMPIYLDNLPAGSSTRPFVQYAQLHLLENEFRKFDFGEKENMVRYGTEIPPSYDLSKITAPVALFVGDKDDLACPADVDYLVTQLPNVIHHEVVDFDGWTHLDFSIGIDADKLIYQTVMNMMLAYD